MRQPNIGKKNSKIISRISAALTSMCSNVFHCGHPELISLTFNMSRTLDVSNSGQKQVLLLAEEINQEREGARKVKEMRKQIWKGAELAGSKKIQKEKNVMGEKGPTEELLEERLLSKTAYCLH